MVLVDHVSVHKSTGVTGPPRDYNLSTCTLLHFTYAGEIDIQTNVVDMEEIYTD